MKKKKPKNILVVGRRWFQRTYGNTYHSVKVYVDGELVASCDERYGYGEQYVQTAGEILEKLGYIHPKHYPNGGNQPLWNYCSENNIKYNHTVTDVSREKDL